MLSGTPFTLQAPELVAAACRGMRRGVASSSEVHEIQAQCQAGRAMCVACEDGMAVVDLRAAADTIEMFIWIAVAFRHGAFGRQEAALRAIARDLGADTIAFTARRRGWGRRLGPEWHRRGLDEFVRPVDVQGR